MTMRMNTAMLVAALAACGGKKDAPPSDPGPASGSGSAKPAPGSGSAKAAAPPPDAAVAAAEPDAPPAEPKAPLAATCIPGYADAAHLAFGKVGAQLVVCAADGEELRACWNLDGKTGAITKRDAAPLPGTGFPVLGKCYQGLCPPEAAADGATLYALHPDGKRAASLSGTDVAVFDLASKKVTSKFSIDIGNSPGQLWFVGDTIYVRGDDAGPASRLNMFKLDGKLAGEPYGGMYHGAAAVSEGQLVVEEVALSIANVHDGVKPARTIGPRPVPKGPCGPGDQLEWDGLGSDTQSAAEKRCAKHLLKHYVPYADAQVVLDGDRLVAFTRGNLFTLDAKTLVEKSRVKLAACPAPKSE